MGVSCVLFGWSSRAAADDARPSIENEPFPLVVSHDKHYLRAGLEVGGILAVGFVDYLLNTNARGGTLRPGESRWDLRYDWPTLRGKLTGADIALDGNKLPTNYVSHPFAGTLYYTAARSNHLSFAESFMYAAAGSTTWEFFGEIRETTSINDLVVTPVSGAAIGEATMQLAGFFQRGRKNVGNGVLSTLFSPVNAVNMWADGAEPERAAATDALGFPTDVWHRFDVRTSAGVTVQEATALSSKATYGDVGLGIDLRLANLLGYASAAKRSRIFDEANVSGVSFDATFSKGGLTSATFATRVVPFGFYARDASLDEDGVLRGHGGFLGLRFGFEYGMHDYDRDRTRPLDHLAVVSPLGIAAEHTFERGSWRVQTSLDLYGSIAGVNAYALSDYRRRSATTGLPNVVASEGYYHAAAVTVRPAVEVAYKGLSAGAEMRLDGFRPIKGVFDDQDKVDRSIRFADQRARLRANLGYSPNGSPVRVTLSGERRFRAGEVDGTHASRTETSLIGSLGFVF